MGGALSGYRVFDLTDEKGMLCSRLLADMGAEVIRVERPEDRESAEPRSSSYCCLNLGKRNITLNLKSANGQEIFKKLVKDADIIVESSPPGFLEKLKLGYSELSAINPGLIMTSITGFGQDGPYCDYKSSDLILSALGGQMYVCGEMDTPPLKPSGNQTYFSACLFAVTGTLLALWERHSSGRGQHIDVSIMECAAATLDHVLVRYFCEGAIARRQGSLHWNNAFRIFPCKDGYILLSLLRHWETLVGLLDAEGMAGDLADKKWQDGEERLRNIGHIIEILERWTKSHNAEELVEKGQLMRFPWAKVTSIPELLASPQLDERDFFIEAECRHINGKLRFPGAPCRLSRSPWQMGHSVAHRGEYNVSVYQEELGLTDSEIYKLIKDKTI